MRKKEPCIILTFYTTADAISLEKYCLLHHLPGRLIPVPRELSSGCGMAWKVPISILTSKEHFLLEIHKSGVFPEQYKEIDA